MESKREMMTRMITDDCIGITGISEWATDFQNQGFITEKDALDAIGRAATHSIQYAAKFLCDQIDDSVIDLAHEMVIDRCN
jgi:hypothetical protein